ncbi:hypothetical protein E4U41_005302 [Claviceps citrina]|nr:hypothetical protein E4U41_005302 [Claviceps citrina]
MALGPSASASSSSSSVSGRDEAAPADGGARGKSFVGQLQDWGSLMATLITALHARPLKPLPLALFAPPLLFSSYLNLSGYQTGSAGLTAAWSGLYAVLALRRRQTLRGKVSARGLVRGAAVGLGAGNAVAGGWVYFGGDFRRDAEERVRRNRWGGGKGE